MKKLCFITAARSEYGHLKWLMRDIASSEEYIFQLIVTGGHLAQEQGHTVGQIMEDGFEISSMVDAKLDMSSTASIAASMGRMAELMAPVFEELGPDYIVVLGDRYELMPICSTALIMGIPIIHLSGGDVTEGAIDDGIRNAVTMMATYHFPGTVDAAGNIARMRGSNENIWAVGEPVLDAFHRMKLLTREELADNLNLDMAKKWVLMTYHAETKESLEHNISGVRNCVEALCGLKGYQVVMTYANADFGGMQINELIKTAADKNPENFKVIPSLGQLRYLSFMKQVSFVIGNSSSGIVEAPFLGVPVVNVGNRQKGRYQCGNIVQCDISRKSIEKAIEDATGRKPDADDLYYWGNGHTAERIEEILRKYICV